MRQPPAIVISRTWTQICTPGSSREGRNRRHYAPIVTARPTGTRIARIVLARQEDPARPPARGKRRQPRDARGQPIPAPSSMREAHARSANGASTGIRVGNVGATTQPDLALRQRKHDLVPPRRPSCSCCLFSLLPLTCGCIISHEVPLCASSNAVAGAL